MQRPGFDYIGVNVSFFCHDAAGRILLQKRSQQARDEQGAWESGGGRVELGETFEEAVSRELAEEYGCTGTITFVLPAIPILREFDGQLTHWVNHAFVLLVNPDEVRLGDPLTTDELGWFDLSALPSPLHRGMQIQLDVHGARLASYLKSLGELV